MFANNAKIEYALAENGKNTEFYKNYKKTYEELIQNLTLYNESFSPSILVPVCSKVLMRGNLVHTNEIMVSLGCDYFMKTNTKQAIEICQRRLQQTNSILENLEKEFEFLTSQIEFTQENILNTDSEEIIEPYDEQIEKEWRIKHRANIAAYRKRELREIEKIDDKELMDKLDELELQEDIELYENKFSDDDFNEANHKLSRHNIENRLLEIRQNKKKCVTEEDVFKRLNELEEEEKLLHELDRLSPNLSSSSESEDSSASDDRVIEHRTESLNESSTMSKQNEFSTELPTLISMNSKKKELDSEPVVMNKKQVSFVDDVQDEAKLTCVINFMHSSNPPTTNENCNTIESPSDIYKLFPNLQKSILKNRSRVNEERHITTEENSFPETNTSQTKQRISVKINVIGDVVEHEDRALNQTKKSLCDNSTRRVSKFKSMRLKNKK